MNSERHVVRYPRLTVGELKKLIVEIGANDDDVIRFGSDSAARFDYLTHIGADNDTGTLILYFDQGAQ